MVWDFPPIGSEVPHLSPPRLTCQSNHLHKHFCERLQMPLAKVTDGAKIWTYLSHHSEKGQIAFARQGDCAARQYPDTVRIQPQADHQGRIERRRSPRRLRIRRMQAAYIQLRVGMQEGKDHVALRKLGGRALRFLLRALRVPRPT